MDGQRERASRLQATTRLEESNNNNDNDNNKDL